MEDKREFNDILIDDRAQYQDRSKKIMLLVVAAAVLLIILLVSAIAMSGTEDKPQAQQVAQENGLQPQPQPNATNTENVEFEPVQTANTADNDRFAQIVKRIQDQNAQSLESKDAIAQSPQTPILEAASQSNTAAQNTAPSTPVIAQPTQPQPVSKPTPAAKPTQPTKPTQAPKSESTPAPVTSPTQPTPQTKPTQAPQPTIQNAQPTTQPTQPTQAVAQTQSTPKPTADGPRPQSTPPMDKSKNGQVAQKGHYIQVGSFENTPNKEFLNKLNNYSYRVYGAQSGTKYLIGPYDSRTDANRDMLKVKTDMGDQVFYYEVK